MIVYNPHISTIIYKQKKVPIKLGVIKTYLNGKVANVHAAPTKEISKRELD